MSHFTTVSIKIRSLAAVELALKDFGITVQKNAPVRGYRGAVISSALVAVLPGDYDMGFDKPGAEVMVTADFGSGLCASVFPGEERISMTDLWTRIRAQAAVYQAREDIERSTTHATAGATINVQVRA